MQNDLCSYSSLSYFASDFKTDFLGEWQKDKHFFFLLNTCTILLSENKTFLLSSKETRFKNNDKILSQLTNRLGYVPTVLRNNMQFGGLSNREAYLEKNSDSRQNTPCHSVHFREEIRRIQVK